MIKNAINYSYENTVITINMIENENDIEIVFKNKWATIPKYKIEKIFDKFYRGDESRQTNNRGTGLRLAITKEIIELHNATISVKSNDEIIEFQIILKKWYYKKKDKLQFIRKKENKLKWIKDFKNKEMWYLKWTN